MCWAREGGGGHRGGGGGVGDKGGVLTGGGGGFQERSISFLSCLLNVFLAYIERCGPDPLISKKRCRYERY